MSDMGLGKKRVLVAGASGGIGLAVAGLLCREGVMVGAHYHQRQGELDALKREVPRLKTFPADLRTQKECHALVDTFVGWAGGIDGLVQCTGHVQRPGEIEETGEADWTADLQVNLSGPFFLAQRAFHHMKSRGGRIVLMSTASARHGGGKTSLAYGAAKAGVECLVKGLARLGAPQGILVNAVAPGFIDTSFHTRVMGRSKEDLDRRAALVPLKRAGTPEDVARLIAHLLSAGGNYITGECIGVSGGDWL